MPVGLSELKTELSKEDSSRAASHQRTGKIFLVGSPNVGKSSIFNILTGSYVTVSNYPGTTVGISKGKMKIGGHHEFEVVDTPGMYSFRPITAEENVSRNLILKGNPACLLHIVDAKNLDRMLPLTLQLIETGHPVILVLNLFDELKDRGMRLDIAHLEHDLGIPVVATVAVRGEGIENLGSRIVEVIEGRYNFKTVERKFSAHVEERLARVCERLGAGETGNGYAVASRSVATLILQRDAEILQHVFGDQGEFELNQLLQGFTSQDMVRLFAQERLAMARDVISDHIEFDETKREGPWKERLSQLMVHPIWGMPFLALVLWFGVYKFVGEFGSGTLVDLIEQNLFINLINPKVDQICRALFGTSTFFDLFAGEYGIVTLGFRYAFAIVLPIVATFFVAFSIIEDSGYLPRLAMLMNRTFNKIGLSGRAVIPITLGFGCDTMATITTRTLETNKERIIATFLLSLAIPCSAQLGVLIGLMANKPVMFVIWSLTMLSVFLLSGWMAKKVFKGGEPTFFMELPPLRLPSVLNVFTKTYSRMIWYFNEVVPVFIAASAIIWLGKLTGAFEVLVRVITYPIRWAGMPEAAAPAFLYGFFRRDFGAAGLFDMAQDGTLSGNGLLVSCVVLTLFIPCIAQFAVTWKERGRGMALGMAAFIFPFSFFVGFLLNSILTLLRVQL